MESFPEEKLAEKLIKKYRLSPPVNIYSLIRKHAHLEEEDIPFNVDAICIKTNGYPHIILNKNIPNVRKRFTLAHEMGHIIIPWHIGTLTTHIDGFQTFEDDLYKIVEAEANRFASKLLIPMRWVEEIINENDEDIENMIITIQESAIVSLPTACISLSQQLKSGYLILITQLDEILYSFQSPDTNVNLPQRNSFEDSLFSKFSSSSGAFENGPYTVFWYKYESAAEFNSTDIRTSSEILNSIIESFDLNNREILHKTQCVNGIIGAANNPRLTTKEMLYQRFMERMSGRPEISDIINHIDFDNFLKKKADEIIKKRQNS